MALMISILHQLSTRKFLKYFEKLAKNGINLRYRVEEKRMGTMVV